MSKHNIVHVEIPAKAGKDAGQFYATVFGWKVVTNEDFDYTMFEPAEGPGGGFTTIDGEQIKPGDVIVYIDTDDIESTLAQIEANGGQTAVPKTEIPGMGHFAHFIDPSGNRVALWTSANMG